jgi:hypothetical protein
MQEAQLWFDCRMYCGAGFNGSHPETLVVATIAYHVDLLATQYSHKVVPATSRCIFRRSTRGEPLQSGLMMGMQYCQRHIVLFS